MMNDTRKFFLFIALCAIGVNSFANAQCTTGTQCQRSTSPFDCLACGSTVCKQCSACATCTSCYNGTYLSGSTCLSCPSNCTYCTSGSNCFKCADGYYLFSGTCIKCDITCRNCVGGGPGACTSCADTSKYVVNGACNGVCPGTCPSGCIGGNSTTCGCFPFQYIRVFPTINGTDQVCSNCSTGCSGCTGSLSSQCTSCNPGRFLSNGTCLLCSANCLTCSGTNSTCTSCASSSYLLPNNTCSQCDASCLTCVNGTTTGCTACASNKYRYPNGTCNNCLSNVQIGWFPNNATQQCQQCDPSCRSCVNASTNGCLTCPMNKYLFSNNGTCGDCNSITNIGWFPNNATQQCQQCHASCLTCFNASTNGCLTCPANKYLFSNNGTCGNCNSITNPGWFPNNATQQCQRCDTSCRTCFNASTNGCMTCPANKYLFSNGTCGDCNSITNPGWFPNNTTQQCQQCDSSCGTCTNSSIYGCLTCATNKYRFVNNSTCGNCVSTVQIGWFPNNATQQCQQCSSTCRTCVNATVNGCTTCPENKYLYPNGTCGDCTSAVQVGWFPNNATQQCQRCDPSCATCFDASATGCLSCPANKYLFTSNNTCNTCNSISNPGWFPDNTTYQCSQCDFTCLTCFNATSRGCISCPTNKYFFPNNNTCRNCDTIAIRVGWFPDNSTYQCKPCDTSCATCVNASVTACVTCPVNKYLFTGNNTCGNCIPSTQIGWYPNNSTYTCSRCDPSCGICVNGSVTGCQTCSAGNYFFPNGTCGACASSVQIGWFPNNATQQCQQCDTSCLTCFNASTNGCLTCPMNKYIFSNNGTCGDCNSITNPGWFPNNATQQCQQCHASCLTCFNASTNGCLTCPANKYLLSNGTCGNCNSITNPGWFPNNATQQCQQCDSSCLTCFNGSTVGCITCPTNNFLFPNSSCGRCDPGWFPDNSTYECNRCNPSCQTCTNASVNACLSCPPNKYLFNGNNSCGSCVSSIQIGWFPNNSSQTCQRCDSSCLTCTGSLTTSCVTCPANKYIFPNGTCGDCDPLQQQGWLPINSQCVQCDPSCATCSGLNTTCTSCHPGYLLEFGSCTSQCDESCVSCLGTPITCTSCHMNEYLVITNNTCSSCYPGAGFFRENSTNVYKCMPCYSTCSLCFNGSANACSGCTEGNYLYIDNSCGSCDPEIEIGFYPNNLTQQCSPCDSLCETCFGANANECLSCHANKFLLNDECVNACPSGYQQNDVSWKCIECSPNSTVCEICQSVSTYCEKCAEGLWNFEGQCYESRSDFTESAYCDIVKLTCEPCHPNCKTCNGTFKNECLSCFPGSPLGLLLDGTCENACPDGMYNSSNVCAQCGTGCEICNSTQCNTCDVGLYLQPGNWNCDYTCPSGYTTDTVNYVCEACEFGCTQCTATSLCSACLPGWFMYNNVCYETRSEVPDSYISCNLKNGTFYDCDGSCHFSCYTCEGITSNDCRSCNGTVTGYEYALLAGSECVEFCPSDTFQNGTVCEDCGFGCRSCSATECLKCTGDLYLQPDGWNCNGTCPFGYFADDVDMTCTHCTPGCTACLNAAVCSQCDYNMFFYDSACYEFHYQIPDVSVNCVLEIPLYGPQYFDCNGLCPDEVCLTCNAVSGDCLSCNGTITGFPYLFEGTCISQCPDGYRPNGPATENGVTCVQCNSGCRDCSSLLYTNDQCYECFNPYDFINNGNCTEGCEPSYPNLENSQCQFCDPLAESHMQLENSSCCVSSCPEFMGTGPFTASTCYWCNDLTSPQTCLSCVFDYRISDSRVCTECISGFVLADGTCYNETCPENYIISTDGKTCLPYSQGCPANSVLSIADNYTCIECTTDSQCLSCYGATGEFCNNCTAGYYLLNNQYCVVACPNGFFPETSFGVATCEPCGSGCNSCDQNTGECIACSISFYLSNGECFFDECPFANQLSVIPQPGEGGVCLECSTQVNCNECYGSTSNCTSCLPGFYILKNVDSTVVNVCLENCPSGYFEDVFFETCAPCSTFDLNCATCDDTACQSCESGYFFESSNNNCYQTCPPGHYPNNQTKTCDQCPRNCRTCSSEDPYICLFDCASPYEYRSVNGTTCIEQCEPGTAAYGIDPYQCLSCSLGCINCTSASNCIDSGTAIPIAEKIKIILRTRSSDPMGYTIQYLRNTQVIDEFNFTLPVIGNYLFNNTDITFEWPFIDMFYTSILPVPIPVTNLNPLSFYPGQLTTVNPDPFWIFTNSWRPGPFSMTVEDQYEVNTGKPLGNEALYACKFVSKISGLEAGVFFYAAQDLNYIVPFVSDGQNAQGYNSLNMNSQP